MSIIVFQPALPKYRSKLFSSLANHFPEFRLYYSSSRSLSSISIKGGQSWASCLGETKTYFFGLFIVNPNFLKVPLAKKDIVVVSGSVRFLTMMIIFLKCKRAGIKVIWWGQYKGAGNSIVGIFLRRIFCYFADSVLFYTRQEAREYLRSPFSNPNVFGLDNGLDSSEIRPLVNLFDAEQRADRFLFIGRLEAKCQLDLALKALKKLNASERCSPIYFDIIGTGSMFSEYLTLADELGVKEYIVWHGPLVVEKDIANIANQCKCFFYPGSVGLSLIHAFNYGLPAVVHSNREMQMPEFDAFINGYNGLSFIQDDIDSLISCFKRVRDDFENLNKLSSGATHTIIESFNIDGMSRQFFTAINGLVLEELE